MYSFASAVSASGGRAIPKVKPPSLYESGELDVSCVTHVPNWILLSGSVYATGS